MGKVKLTKRERAVLNVIKHNMVIKPPTQETIGNFLGIKKQTVNEHIKSLKEKGYVTKDGYPVELEGGDIIFNGTNFNEFNFDVLLKDAK